MINLKKKPSKIYGNSQRYNNNMFYIIKKEKQCKYFTCIFMNENFIGQKVTEKMG